MKIQVTLLSTTGKYKPVSALVEVDSAEYFLGHKREVQEKGVVKICQKRYWSVTDLKKYGYTHCKMRKYPEQKEVK